MKLKDLIERLQAVYDEANISAHGEPVVDLIVDCDVLNDEYDALTIQEIEANLRIGCACVDGVTIYVGQKKTLN